MILRFAHFVAGAAIFILCDQARAAFINEQHAHTVRSLDSQPTSVSASVTSSFFSFQSGNTTLEYFSGCDLRPKCADSSTVTTDFSFVLPSINVASDFVIGFSNLRIFFEDPNPNYYFSIYADRPSQVPVDNSQPSTPGAIEANLMYRESFSSVMFGGQVFSYSDFRSAVSDLTAPSAAPFEYSITHGQDLTIFGELQVYEFVAFDGYYSGVNTQFEIDNLTGTKIVPVHASIQVVLDTPEPGTCALALLATLGWLAFRLRHGRGPNHCPPITAKISAVP